MMIHSDWHIHSDASYDSQLPVEEIARNAKSFGFYKFGITDHVNYNDRKFLADFEASARNITKTKQYWDNPIFGVELTPIEKNLFNYIAEHGDGEGFAESNCGYGIELALSKEELVAAGVRYAIGAAHWRIDPAKSYSDMQATLAEWHRQQLWLACDSRVTILGHPWYNGAGMWYSDFALIPRSMNMELAAALKENGKFVECNSHFFISPKTDENFRHRYAEFLRELFEMGIPVTYGSDSHNSYVDKHIAVEKYLLAAGFADGDLSDLGEEDFW